MAALRRAPLLASLPLLVLGLAGPVAADTVHLRNGRAYEGG